MGQPKFRAKLSKEELKEITSSRRKKSKDTFLVAWSTELGENGEMHDTIQLVPVKKE